MLMRKSGAYPSGAPKRSSPSGKALGVTHKHCTRLERLFKDKHSSLLRIFPDYGRKKFYNIGPREGARTLSLTTLNITAVSVQFNYAESRVFVVMLSTAMLNVVAQ
jgi:hypothetical protein